MHYMFKYSLCSIIVVLCCLQEYCLSQSSTVRPYKFGFTIDQQQHRSEQRDERGIVMGEFGFITADGIYHVTVYATDEQGRFRILAMKSYPYESPPKTVEVMVKPKIPIPTKTTPKPLTRHNFNTEACSGCFLKNGNNKPKDVNGIQEKTMNNGIRPLSKPLDSESNAPASPKLPNQSSSAKTETKMANRNKNIVNNSQIYSNAQMFSNTQSNAPTTSLHSHTESIKDVLRNPDIIKTIQLNTPVIPMLFTLERTEKKVGKKYENIPTKSLNNSPVNTKLQETNKLLSAPNALSKKQHNTPFVEYKNTDSGEKLLENKATAFVKDNTNHLTTNTAITPPNTLKQQTLNNSPQSLQTKTTAQQGNTLQNAPMTSSIPLKKDTPQQLSSPQTYNTISGQTQTNTFSKDTNQQSITSKPTAGGTSLIPASKTATGSSNPPIMDIIMQKVLPTLMGSKGSTPSIGNDRPNVPSAKKSDSSNSGIDSRRVAGGSAKGDGDLYRFKYILDYHGHSETGKRNGDKEGTYYAIGDDNVERTIEYVANEFGYQPRIRWRKLDANDIKSNENTLKDYEFVWFN